MLRVATFAGGSWQILSGAAVDTQTQMVSGTTTHLSPYGLTSAATGSMCATVTGGLSCSGGTVDTGGIRHRRHDRRGARGERRDHQVDLHAQHLRRSDESLRRLSGRHHVRLHGWPERLHGGLLLPVGRINLPGGWRRDQRMHRGLLGRRVLHDDLPTDADLRRRHDRHRLQRPHRRDRPNCVDGASGYTAACCFAPEHRSARPSAPREAAEARRTGRRPARPLSHLRRR